MDLEKQSHHDTKDNATSSHDPLSLRTTIDPDVDPGEVQVTMIRQRYNILRFLRNCETWVDSKMNFEAMGVERVPEHMRKPPQILNMIFLWFSLLFNPTLIPIGTIGPIFGLSVHTSVILTVFATLTGSLVPSFTGTLCPLTGLRQIAVSRYAFGIWGAKLCSLLNIIVNIGFAVIASVIGGQLLAAVSAGSLPLVVGIVIIVTLMFIISFFGFAVIHHYERYAWVFAFVLLCVLWGQSSKYFSPTPGLNSLDGVDYTGACLSYFAVIFGLCSSWCAITGDYYVHYPENTSRWLVFGLTYVGQCIPTIFVGILGNYFGGIIQSNTDLSDIYYDGGIGALILATQSPTGWAKFSCIFFFLSFLANTIANIYSSALSIQLWGQHFIAVPRFLWCFVLSAITLALAWGGRNKLETIINNLVSMIGYWTVAFATILFIEHFWFRRRLGGYDLTAWQDNKRMPVGVAGVAALLIGIGFSFLGMDQTWYVAPIARKTGSYGGDVGDELTLASVLISYPILRMLEIRMTGR
ncbi:hypothetical protein MMC14_009120 [Varicellaria rhodocarpa]|nr:hypothetical protein [Varicellaria rhodocarpa]